MQMDFFIRSPENDERNNQGRKVFDHFFAMEVGVLVSRIGFVVALWLIFTASTRRSRRHRYMKASSSHGT